jgi:hypothetical protein
MGPKTGGKQTGQLNYVSLRYAVQPGEEALIQDWKVKPFLCKVAVLLIPNFGLRDLRV